MQILYIIKNISKVIFFFIILFAGQKQSLQLLIVKKQNEIEVTANVSTSGFKQVQAPTIAFKQTSIYCYTGSTLGVIKENSKKHFKIFTDYY